MSMRRIGYIVLGVVVLAWLVAAIATGSADLGLSSSGGGSGTTASASPKCLPTTLEHDARLAGTSVEVSPAPGTDTANPATQISFLGAPAAKIADVRVSGRSSGAHAGRIEGYSQGDGASFVPAKPFAPGEQVTVDATVSGTPVSYGFRVDEPYSTAHSKPFGNPEAAPSDYQSFYSQPGMKAPVMTVTVADRDPSAGDILTTNGPGPGQYGPLIYNPQGRLVWFQRLPAGETAEDLNEQEYEGRRVLTWWRGKVLALGFGQGEDVVMNDRYETIAHVHGGNGLKADLHEFHIEPGDIAYVTAFNPMRCDLTSQHGVADGAITDTAIQEIDMRTGLVRWEWHSLDHVGAGESEVETPTGPTPWDWFHINSIDPQGNGDVFISARNTWAGYDIEAATGKILWRLGGLKSSFKMGPGTKTAWQHDGRVLPNGEITFFDDGSNPPIHSQSRAIRIALNLETHEARLVSSLTHPDPPVLAPSQGNMQTLASGNVLVGYGGLPEITEYAPDGTQLLDAHQPYDMPFYRAYRFPWSATPAAPPSVLASLSNTSEETIVHASWNGATGVASWRILAGKENGPLAVLASIPDSGFESSATLPKVYERVAVQALAADGRLLGSSQPAKVIGYAASLRGAG